jgi:hypothetical protein
MWTVMAASTVTHGGLDQLKDDDNASESADDDHLSDSADGVHLAKIEYNFRRSSIENRIKTEQRRRNKRKEPIEKIKAPPLSKYRRKTANGRERHRMLEINSAFETLQEVLPNIECEQNTKITKITTLRLAMNYIAALRQMLGNDDAKDEHSTDDKPESDINMQGQQTIAPLSQDQHTTDQTTSHQSSEKQNTIAPDQSTEEHQQTGQSALRLPPIDQSVHMLDATDQSTLNQDTSDQSSPGLQPRDQRELLLRTEQSVQSQNAHDLHIPVQFHNFPTPQYAPNQLASSMHYVPSSRIDTNRQTFSNRDGAQYSTEHSSVTYHIPGHSSNVHHSPPYYPEHIHRIPDRLPPTYEQAISQIASRQRACDTTSNTRKISVKDEPIADGTVSRTSSISSVDEDRCLSPASDAEHVIGGNACTKTNRPNDCSFDLDIESLMNYGSELFS